MAGVSLVFHCACFAACAACFSLRAMFRVCHDLLSVFGFGFSFLRDSRLCGVVVFAIYPLLSVICQVGAAHLLQRKPELKRNTNRKWPFVF